MDVPWQSFVPLAYISRRHASMIYEVEHCWFVGFPQ